MDKHKTWAATATARTMAIRAGQSGVGGSESEGVIAAFDRGTGARQAGQCLIKPTSSATSRPQTKNVGEPKKRWGVPAVRLGVYVRGVEVAVGG
jgi:hypothetical protein